MNVVCILNVILVEQLGWFTFDTHVPVSVVRVMLGWCLLVLADGSQETSRVLADRRSKVKKKAQFADNDEVFILGEFQGPVASNQSSPSKTLTTKPTTSILKNSPLRKGNAQDGSPGTISAQNRTPGSL